MAVKPRNLHRKHWPHPNVAMVPVIKAESSTQRYVATVALSGLSAGSKLTVLDTGWYPGGAASVFFTMSGTGPTVVLKVSGADLYGKPVSDTVTMAATGTHGTVCFASVSEVEVVSVASAGAETISLGYAALAGTRIALPCRVRSSVYGDA